MPANDELTGLLTRASFSEQFEEYARGSKHLVVIHIDLDHMLSINEKYGHVAGDEWIKRIAALIREAFEQTGEGPGIICRYGGDEFIAVVRAKELFEVYETAEQLRQRVENDPPTITIDGQPTALPYTLSFGLAAFPANASDPNDLLEKGKDALYRAKQAGGNQVCFYQESDTLTGLRNFIASQRSLEQALVLAKQKSQPLSIVLIDLDHFKEINDEYGHRAGDEVLKRLAHILENNFDSGSKATGGTASVGRIVGKDAAAAQNIISRIAGDEFLVILPGQQADSAFILAEEVRRLVEDSPITLTLGGGEDGARKLSIRFTISGGIASYPTDASERVDLLRKADEALYRSKAIGRNRLSLPTSAQMITKTSYYTQIQLERLAALARKMDKTEAFLLREALDDLLRKYDPAAQG